MSGLEQHTRADFLRLQSEALRFADRAQDGEHLDDEAMRGFVDRLRRAATHDSPSSGLLRASLVAVEAIVAGSATEVDEATRFLQAAVAASHGARAPIRDDELPDVDPSLVLEGKGRLVDDALGYLDEDLQGSCFTGGFFLNEESVARWLDRHAEREGNNLIERLEESLDRLRASRLSIALLGDIRHAGQPWLVEALAALLPPEEYAARAEGRQSAPPSDVGVTVVVANVAHEIAMALGELPKLQPGKLFLPDALALELRRRWMARSRGRTSDVPVAALLEPHQALALLRRSRDKGGAMRANLPVGAAVWDAWYASARDVVVRARGPSSPSSSSFDSITMGAYPLGAGDAYWERKRLEWLDAACVALDQIIEDLEAEIGVVPSVGIGNPAVASSLRQHLSRLPNPSVRGFVEEAIGCIEAQHFRAAIVLSWVGALAVLYDHVVGKHLQDFNNEATRRNANWKSAKTADDLARMKEFDFLDTLDAIGVVQKNVKAELQDCLRRRNGCGHPNSMKLGEATVAHHVEILVRNVFEMFV